MLFAYLKCVYSKLNKYVFRLLVSSVFGFFFLLVFFNYLLVPKPSKRESVREWHPRIISNSCHTSRYRDGLTLLRKNATMPEKSIFFHETKCSGGLNSREACAVESAAKANPDYQINVLFTSSVKKETLEARCLSTLLENYENVKFFRVRIPDYAYGTPIEETVKQLNEDAIHRHASNMIKYLTMYKYGGIYLGLDVMVARSLDLWVNWAVRDSPATLSTTIFAFSRNKAGNKLAEDALGYLEEEILNNNFKESFWIDSTPSVIEKTLENWCTTTEVPLMSITTCPDFAVYNTNLFYPISFYDRQQYFNIVDEELYKHKQIYTYVIWSHYAKYKLITPDMFYAQLANQYCPMIYNRFGDQYGYWYPVSSLP